MRTADMEIGGFVHLLHITYGGTRTRVEPACDHGDAECVLAVLCGIDLHCDWPAAVLQHVLRRHITFEEACTWTHVPVSPTHPHWMGLWKAPHLKRPWSLIDLERWRKEGWTAGQCAAFCDRYPHRVNYLKGPR
jgi:hypothetical protein